MKKYHKLKVCLIKAGKVTTELPDDFFFERNVLEGLSQGMTQHIKEIILPNQEVFFMAWISEEEKEEGKALLQKTPMPLLNPQIFAKFLDEKNWFVMDFMFEVQLKHLKKVAWK